MKFIMILATLILFLSGCEDKGYGTQDIDSIMGVGATAKVILTSSVPAINANIAQKSFITVSFSSQMDADTLQSDSVILKDNNGIDISVSLLVSENHLFIRPRSSLVDGMGYQLTLKSSFKDIFGNALAQEYLLDFTCTSDFWLSVAAGKTHVIAVSKANDVYVWGNNPLLDVMLNETNLSKISIDIPLPLPKVKKPLSYSAGSYASGMIDSAGKIVTSGLNKLDNVEENGYTQISLGANHEMVLKDDGTLYSWGSNDNGQLGTLGVFSKQKPTQEYSQSMEWISISAGNSFSLALKLDGSMWGWGRNDYGQIGNKEFQERRQPVREDTNGTWKMISAGSSFSAAIRGDNTLWSWGKNDSGELGDGTNISSNIAVQESTLSSWTQVSTGFSHTVGINNAKEIFSWGSNRYGELGDNSTVNKNSPTAIDKTLNGPWIDVSGGDGFTLAVGVDGTLWSWGHNAHGELGIGLEKGDSLIPVEVK